MKKVLIIEITVFVLLIGLAVCALTGVFSPSDAPLETTETTAETVAQPVFEVVVSPKPKADWETFPGRKLTCERFFVYDCETNTMMAQYGEDTKLYPASITKLLTAYTALQYLKPADKVVAGDALDLVAADSSIAFIRRGDTLAVEQLVEAMMLPSGNDAAYITAVAAGREIAHNPELAPAEAADVFVRQMNITAKNAGMTGSNFMNPDGY
ncbi:MAG: D-alanyl-D-alanine carboxypeptidase, partial [Oscillospiraceae bacterium]|nr:D-alanyl-D-alanine carboxypeptidase [Oscillospiraceae bacterium]